MTRKVPYQVMPDNIQGGWNVVRENPEDPEARFPSREDALKYAERSSREKLADMTVFDQQGDVDYTIVRSKDGASINVEDPKAEILSRELRDIEKQNPGIRYFQKGPIQPKG